MYRIACIFISPAPASFQSRPRKLKDYQLGPFQIKAVLDTSSYLLANGQS